MVAPVPAQISTLGSRPPAGGRRRRLLATYHSLPTLVFPAFSTQPLCFLSHPCNPNSFMQLRTLLRNGEPLSLLFSMASALFLLPRGCASKACPTTDFQASHMSTPLFTRAWRLFALSLRLFLHRFPLFSIACSLFSKNTRGGGYRFLLSTSAGNQEVST